MSIKVIMLRVRKKGLSLHYKKQNLKGIEEDFRIESVDIPRPEMKDAYWEVRDIFFEYFKQFKFLKNKPTIQTVNLRYGGKNFEKDEISAIKIDGRIENIDCDGLKYSTDWLEITDKKRQAVMEKLNKLIYEAEAFIRGDRAQESLFKEENNASDAEQGAEEE